MGVTAVSNLLKSWLSSLAMSVNFVVARDGIDSAQHLTYVAVLQI